MLGSIRPAFTTTWQAEGLLSHILNLIGFQVGRASTCVQKGLIGLVLHPCCPGKHRLVVAIVLIHGKKLVSIGGVPG